MNTMRKKRNIVHKNQESGSVLAAAKSEPLSCYVGEGEVRK